MNTVITHFYNEEYLLPWWIDHHRRLFDHGIMINHHSTDRSLEICKDLCPSNWKIVDSRNYNFDAIACDNEVKDYEATVEGFKIALTSTEFFLTPVPLEELNYQIKNNNEQCIKTIGVAMVDVEPDKLPTYDLPLCVQKHHGMISGYTTPDGNVDHFKIVYGRHYHNLPFGNYHPGRHFIMDKSRDVSNVFTLKHKYSPWNENLIKRMVQIGEKVPESDLNSHMGSIHLATSDQIISDYNHYLTTAYDLKTDPSFLDAYDYCMNYT